MKKNKEKFGKLLSIFRKRAGLSQNELAQLIELSPSHLSKIEQGNRNPLRKNNLAKIIKVLSLGEEEQRELLIAAGYSPGIYRPLVYPSPIVKNTLVDDTDNKLAKKLLENPALKFLYEVFNDPKIPDSEKKEIESQVFAFARWLVSNIKR